MTKLSREFEATLQKSPAKGGWTYVVMPGSAEFFGTGGLVKVRGTVDGEPFESDGVVGRQGARLASSVSGMDRMVRTMVGATSASLAEVVRMATLTPAERAGIADEVGSLEPGKRADVLVLGSGLEVERVFLAGEEVR